jgi:hypothetical protein
MLAALLRLFELRPFFTIAILGFPLILLVVVGLFTILALKFILFVVLPVAAAIWLLRKIFGPSPNSDC